MFDEDQHLRDMLTDLALKPSVSELIIRRPSLALDGSASVGTKLDVPAFVNNFKERSHLLAQLQNLDDAVRGRQVILRRDRAEKQQLEAANLHSRDPALRQKLAAVKVEISKNEAKVNALTQQIYETKKALAVKEEECLALREVLANPLTMVSKSEMNDESYSRLLEVELMEMARQLSLRDQVISDFQRQARDLGFRLKVHPDVEKLVAHNFVVPDTDRSFVVTARSGVSSSIQSPNYDDVSTPIASTPTTVSTARSSGRDGSFKESAMRALQDLNQRKESRRSIGRPMVENGATLPELPDLSLEPPDKLGDLPGPPMGIETRSASSLGKRVSWNAPAHAVVRYARELSELYDVYETLGHGGFSVVKRGVDRVTGNNFALKIMENAVFKKNQRHIETEVHVIAGFDHPRLVKFREVIRTPNHFVLVTELVKGGELFDKIVQMKKFSEGTARDLMWQILDAVEVLHINGVLHRDLKPENILLSEEGPDGSLQIKLTDFGLAIYYDEDNPISHLAGTPEYAAPEVLSRKNYGYPCDMWSLGVILYIMLCGFPPFYGPTPSHVINKVTAGSYKFPKPHWDQISDQARDLVTKLLDLNPETRYTIRQVRKHPWMAVANSNRVTPTVEALKKFNASRRLRKAVLSENNLDVTAPRSSEDLRSVRSAEERPARMMDANSGSGGPDDPIVLHAILPGTNGTPVKSKSRRSVSKLFGRKRAEQPEEPPSPPADYDVGPPLPGRLSTANLSLKTADDQMSQGAMSSDRSPTKRSSRQSVPSKPGKEKESRRSSGLYQRLVKGRSFKS
eukprot:c20648_g2_i1.p1 GENE.c20648_g2_i1~~c20648_g2_i1.p1  ORF type:complete len:863 (+),score=160.72 c20648_g2_i1:197-2590(+)